MQGKRPGQPVSGLGNRSRGGAPDVRSREGCQWRESPMHHKPPSAVQTTSSGRHHPLLAVRTNASGLERLVFLFCFLPLEVGQYCLWGPEMHFCIFVSHPCGFNYGCVSCSTWV